MDPAKQENSESVASHSSTERNSIEQAAKEYAKFMPIDPRDQAIRHFIEGAKWYARQQRSNEYTFQDSV